MHRPGNSVCEFLTAPLAKESTLVMMPSTNCDEVVDSKLVAPIAKVAFRSPINRDGLAKCIVRHMLPSLLHRPLVIALLVEGLTPWWASLLG
jgi:hypothetical protein